MKKIYRVWTSHESSDSVHHGAIKDQSGLTLCGIKLRNSKVFVAVPFLEFDTEKFPITCSECLNAQVAV